MNNREFDRIISEAVNSTLADYSNGMLDEAINREQVKKALLNVLGAAGMTAAMGASLLMSPDYQPDNSDVWSDEDRAEVASFDAARDRQGLTVRDLDDIRNAKLDSIRGNGMRESRRYGRNRI